MAALSYAEQVQQAYLAYYGRPADPAGQQYWVNQLTAANGNLNSIINAFGNSAESTALYGGSGTAAQVNAIYQTLFGRPADVTGLNYYVNGIVSGQFTLASVALNIYYGATGNDATELTAKLAYADSFTAALSQSVAGQVAYSGNAAASNARAAVASVVDSASQATATAALSTTISNIGTGAVSQTVTLTTGVDTLNGTSGNDVFVGDDTGANPTVSAADSINGGTGADTFKHYLASGVTTITNPSLTNVETLYINGGGAVTADLSKIAGVTGVQIDNLGGAATYTLNGNEALTVLNDNGATVRNVSAIYGATDAAASITLNTVGKAGAAATVDVKGAALATLNLTSTGAANVVNLTNSGTAKLATLNLSGDQKLTLTEGLNGVKTINASTDTGGVTVDTTGATSKDAAFAFTGGSGNDNLKLAAGDLGLLTKGSQLDGGAGTDTLTIGDTTISAATTTLNTPLNAVQHFETLAFSAATAISADLSQVTSFSTFDLAGAVNTTGAIGTDSSAAAAGTAGGAGTAATVAATFTGEGNAHSIIVDANISAIGGVGGLGSATAAGGVGGAGAAGASALSITPLVDNGSNTVTLTLDGVTLNSSGGNGGAAQGTGANNGGAGGAAATTVNASSFEKVSIISNASADGTVTANAFTANGGVGGAHTGAGTDGSVGAAAAGLTVGTNATVSISGAADLNTGLISGQNVTVDASSLTGKLTVATGNDGNHTIIGGSNVNTITLGGGADSIDLTHSLAKSDTVNVNSAANQDATAGKFVSITGFGDIASNGDTLHIAGVDATAVPAGDVSNIVTGVANLLASSAKGIVTFSGSAAAGATLTQEVTAAFAVLGSSSTKAVAFVYGNDTYVAHETGANAGYQAGVDTVVKLVGVHDLTALGGTAGAATLHFA